MVVCVILSVPSRSCTTAILEESGRNGFPLLCEILYQDNLLIMEYKGKGHTITGHEGRKGEQRYSSTLP